MDGKPRQTVREAGEISSVAISGHDFPDVRPDFAIEPGDRVRAGQTIFADRRRPEIAFTAPAAGVVTAINQGRRRSLDSLIIRIEGDEAVVFPIPDAPVAPEEVRSLLLKSGLWPSFQTRPFGRIPGPDTVPDAIFVTAMDTNPLAADPRVVIRVHEEEFRQGLDVLPALTPGPVFICQATGPSLYDGAHDRIRQIVFSGPHPAGLPGTHVHHLTPVAKGKSVWQVGYRDVIAIGHLLSTGRLMTDRIVALAGSGVRDPALVRLPTGASLDEALDGQLVDGPMRVISGPVLSGREAGYLGRYHNQVTVIALNQGKAAAPGFLSTLSGFFTGVPDAAIIPREAFERVVPLDIMPVPLLRALSVGDVETARDLGCLELVEEDLALLSHVCTTGTDYGTLLREVLDEIEADR